MQNLPFIPYFKTSRYRVDSMIELANIQEGERAADLGSGDGRIVIKLAKAGAKVDGFELDPILLQESRIAIEQEKMSKLATIIEKDFWPEDLSKYSIITIYPMPDIMEELERKLFTELRVGAKVLLNYYPFPNWPVTTIKDHIYLYTR